MRALMVAGAAGLALLASAAEAASVVVLGETRAGACYQAAKSGAAGVLALAECDAALDEALSSRDRAATLVNRGVILLKRRDAAAAEASFRAALAITPGLAAATANLGAARILAGDAEGAVGIISQAIAAGAPEVHESYYNRALAYEALDRYAEALADYETAARLKPDWPAPREEMARFTVSQGSRPGS